MKDKVLSMLIIFSLSFSPALLSTENKMIKECRIINKNITYYESKRKGGGSAKKMDQWLRKIHDYKDQYSDNNCMKHRQRIE